MKSATAFFVAFLAIVHTVSAGAQHEMPQPSITKPHPTEPPGGKHGQPGSFGPPPGGNEGHGHSQQNNHHGPFPPFPAPEHNPRPDNSWNHAFAGHDHHREPRDTMEEGSWLGDWFSQVKTEKLEGHHRKYPVVNRRA